LPWVQCRRGQNTAHTAKAGSPHLSWAVEQGIKPEGKLELQLGKLCIGRYLKQGAAC